MLGHAFQASIASLIPFRAKVLLAVSGGIDSMVMLDLFQQDEFPFAVAHCNFQLRGNDSDEDQAFIREYCAAHQLHFHSIAFDTASISKQSQGENIQLTARRLRYEWFEELCQKEGYTHIATAHHLNDSVETVLYNFTKGTGIKGMTGIPRKNQQIIRPLLNFSKKQLEAYAKEKQLIYRDDASNASTYYDRNKIRLEVIPVLEQINPRFIEKAQGNMQRFQDMERLLEATIKTFNEAHLIVQHEQKQWPIQALRNHPIKDTLLYELLAPYGFHADQVQQALACDTTGSLFYSPTHRLLVERAHYVLEAIQEQSQDEYILEDFVKTFDLPNGRLHFEYMEGSINDLPKQKGIAYFDADLFTFPITVRKWKAGDQFQPFGMGGKHQSLKKYFVNQKISRFDKEQVWLLCCQDQIAWIVGHRMDERFKVSKAAKRMLRVEWEGNIK